MLKIECIPPMTAKQLADDHFDSYNPRVKDGPRKDLFYLRSLIHKIDNAIANHQGEEKRMFQYFKGPGNARTKAILSGSPPLLQRIADDFEAKFPNIVFSEENDEGKQVLTAIGRTVAGIFNYKTYRQSARCMNNLKSLGIKRRIPCPYCNCEIIDIISYDDHHEEEQEQALLDLDHFLPKSRFPFLAISIFNLVPCCHKCNSHIKKDKAFALSTHIHPFMESFEEHFTFKLETPYYDGMDIDELEILCDNRLNDPFPKNSVTDLRILSRYHNAVEELHDMFISLSDNTYELIGALFDQHEAEIRRKKDFRAMRIPVNRREISKYLFGKLKIDLHDEFLNVTTP